MVALRPKHHGCYNITVETDKNAHTPALSEKIAHPTVYHHISQLSVDIQLNGPIKCKEDSGVQMKLTQVIFHSLSWIHLSQVH